MIERVFPRNRGWGQSPPLPISRDILFRLRNISNVNMKRISLYFEGPKKVGIREEEIPALDGGEVLVRSIASAISPGTELLIYNDQAPKGMAADSTIAALEGQFNYPIKYGYAVVGEVTELGSNVEHQWMGKRVFAFNPHESHFITQPQHLHIVPEGLATEAALFVPNIETAINFVLDGKPLLGERVAVFGQGIVGLLTTSILSQFPLDELVSIDRFENRRTASLAAGANQSIQPSGLNSLRNRWTAGADLIFELSGSPKALNQAIQLAGFESRIVIGSWYGDKPSEINLGGEFHRNRIKLLSSQVSSIAAELRGRWDKPRRFELVWEKLAQLQPSQFITHRFPLEHAAEAYHLLDQQPESAIQVIFEHAG